MTEQLFDLITKADVELTDINNFGGAIVALSKYPAPTETLVDLLRDSAEHYGKFWAEIESSDEFKTTYGGDRLKLLHAYDVRKLGGQ